MLSLRRIWRALDLERRWRDLKERAAGPRRLVRMEGDVPPKKMPARDLVLLSERGEQWSVAMRCPCGCGDNVELLLIAEAKPRWNLNVDRKGRPTLHPSVWRREGCLSHYFVRDGKVVWV
jgi:hypothetical protein